MAKPRHSTVGDIKRLLEHAKVPFDKASKVLGLGKGGLEKLDSGTIFAMDMVHTLQQHFDLPTTGFKNSGSAMKAPAEPANRLRQVREELDLNQADFGEKIGLTQAGVSKFEMRQIPLRKLILLAIEHVYGIRSEWFLNGKEPKYLSNKRLGQAEIETLEIATKLKTDDRHLWQQMGQALLNARWDGKMERRRKTRQEKGAPQDTEKKAP